jgi:hypothetical protein
MNITDKQIHSDVTGIFYVKKFHSKATINWWLSYNLGLKDKKRLVFLYCNVIDKSYKKLNHNKPDITLVNKNARISDWL